MKYGIQWKVNTERKLSNLVHFMRIHHDQFVIMCYKKDKLIDYLIYFVKNQIHFVVSAISGIYIQTSLTA